MPPYDDEDLNAARLAGKEAVIKELQEYLDGWAGHTFQNPYIRGYIEAVRDCIQFAQGADV